MRIAEWVAGLALVLAAHPLMVQQAGTKQVADVPLNPSSPWNVEYGDSICTLSRNFTGPDGPVMLAFAPLTGGGQLKMLVVGLPTGERIGYGKALVSAKADEPMARDYYAIADAKTGKPILLIKARRGDIWQIGSAVVLTIDVKGKRARFAVPGIADAMKALDACEVDLARSWGYDPAAVTKAAAPIDPGEWLTNDDYPRSAMARQEAGETDYRMTIGLNGRPTGCLVTLKSGSPALDTQTCETLMRRARFTPAAGADGKPVPGVYSNAVMWMIADD